MCGWQEKLYDPLVTHWPYLSALEVRHDEALYKSTFTLLYFTSHEQENFGQSHVADFRNTVRFFSFSMLTTSGFKWAFN